MTNQEAIQELAGMYQVIITDSLTSTIDAEDKNTAIDMAIAALEAHEPVEPKYIEFEDTGVTWEKYEVATCGKCGTLLGGALYCPMCGQAVKWQ